MYRSKESPAHPCVLSATITEKETRQKTMPQTLSPTFAFLTIASLFVRRRIPSTTLDRRSPAAPSAASVSAFSGEGAAGGDCAGMPISSQRWEWGGGGGGEGGGRARVSLRVIRWTAGESFGGVAGVDDRRFDSMVGKVVSLGEVGQVACLWSLASLINHVFFYFIII